MNATKLPRVQAPSARILTRPDWTDRTKKPLIGMRVRAYFRGELDTKTVVKWYKKECVFHDGSSLYWHNDLGFMLW